MPFQIKCKVQARYMMHNNEEQHHTSMEVIQCHYRPTFVKNTLYLVALALAGPDLSVESSFAHIWILHTVYTVRNVLLISTKCGASVASFPGRSHLQYLIAYSMQIRRGKAWEIWSRA